MVSTAPSAAVACADYALRLSDSLAHTHHANDRPVYQRLLADAASLLALLVRERDSAEIARAIQQHERLSSELFLSGAEHEAIADAWRKFTDAYGTPNI